MSKQFDLQSLSEISLADFISFMELSQLLSVRELARRRNRTPSQVSRSLSAVERALGKTLMNRSALGMSLTEDGHRLVESLEKISKYAEEILGSSATVQQLSLGSISFLTTRLVAPMLGRLQTIFPDVRLIDFPPDEMVSNGIRGAFDVALHLGVRDWPQSWFSKRIGEISWTLCMRKEHPLARVKNPGLEDILKYPFIYPVYWGRSGLVIGDDQFPVSIYKRLRGAATSTADGAVEVMMSTDQLAFLPDVIVLNEIHRGRLISILPETYRVTKPLYLTARADIITQKKFNLLQNEFAKFLEELRRGD